MAFVPSEHQAAGHDGCLTAGPVFAKLTSQQEIDFYAELALLAPAEADLGSHLSHWMPTYMGTLQQGAIGGDEAIVVKDAVEGLVEGAAASAAADSANTSDSAKPDKRYLVLQNLYHGFLKPSILDIKLGAVLVDDTVTEEKRQRLAKVSESTTSGSLHLRVCGMKTYRGNCTTKPDTEVFPGLNETVEVIKSEDGHFLKYNKFYGRKLTDETVADGILEFFNSDLVNSKFLLTRFHQRLQLLYNCLLDTEVRIVAGSLFFIYESDPEKWHELDEDSYFAKDPLIGEDPDNEDEDDEDPQNTPLSRLNFIDFSHSKYVEGQGHDENVIVGVENLINIFGKLAEQEQLTEQE
ncbi:CIC11C00000003490 [Sungouiella intermedia]|uniref:Kinase n=1 Tax=Sungouiella intermedia TaxID=45354 RepID=A0A1L0BQG7_9ASCO|nr:CIC11C00000003490 [[Candida] intermedia]